MRKRAFLPQALRKIIARFGNTGYRRGQPCRRRKTVRSYDVEDVTAIFEHSMDYFIGCSSAREVRQQLNAPYSTVRNVKKKKKYCIISLTNCHNQQLLAIEREKRLTFVL